MGTENTLCKNNQN